MKQVMEKLEQHDAVLERLLEKTESHDKQLELIARTVQDHDRRFDLQDERFATKQDLERFATKEDLKRFATKEDYDKVMQRLDQIILMFQKQGEELVSIAHNVRELNDKTDRHDEFIQQAPPLLGL